MGWLTARKKRNRREEDEKDARLENAERELADLKMRSERAVRTLSARHRRNHWTESVENMIQGVR